MEIFLACLVAIPFQVAAFSLAYHFPIPCLITYVEILRRRTVQHSFAVLYAAVK